MPKVLYDISILGLGYYDNLYRSGIYRVIETLAVELLKIDDCDLSFCAYAGITTMIKANKYFCDNSILKDGSWYVPRSEKARITLNLLSKLYPKPGEEKGPRLWLLQLCRFLAKRSGVLHPMRDMELLRNADIFHSTFWPLPEVVHTSLRMKRFMTIYDLIPILYPKYVNTGSDHILKVVRSISPNDFVLSISQYTKQDLCEFTDIDPERVLVTPLAASSSFYCCKDSTILKDARTKYGIPEAPYILSLSAPEPRKNISQTIRCFSRVVEEGGHPDINLVLVGAKGWDYSSTFDKLKISTTIRKRIIVPGYVADEDLAAVYSGALMFVYPSFYEGFGLPPLEAMQCGVPVITSNTSSLPEVVGDAGIMVDPTDSDALCQAISDLYADAGQREDLKRKSLARAQEFSWSKCAAQTFSAYQAALSS